MYTCVYIYVYGCIGKEKFNVLRLLPAAQVIDASRPVLLVCVIFLMLVSTHFIVDLADIPQLDTTKEYYSLGYWSGRQIGMIMIVWRLCIPFYSLRIRSASATFCVGTLMESLFVWMGNTGTACESTCGEDFKGVPCTYQYHVCVPTQGCPGDPLGPGDPPGIHWGSPEDRLGILSGSPGVPWGFPKADGWAVWDARVT